ncbi:putative quinol monooxygenase [Nocardia sp. NPDC004068]|uniref:putative quinol monooxygenase n=1 Tax=Nocardia sp. NPDC004068 TaxID=3364303 RepID=UPI0036A3BA2E
MGSSYVLVIADVSSRPEDAEEFGQALEALAGACRDEPGCLSYNVFRSTDRPERFVSIEKYADSAAFTAHRESAHFREIGLGRVMPLAVDRDVQMYTSGAPIPPAPNPRRAE